MLPRRGAIFRLPDADLEAIIDFECFDKLFAQERGNFYLLLLHAKHGVLTFPVEFNRGRVDAAGEI